MLDKKVTTPWKEIRIDTWRDFEKFTSEECKEYRQWVFRGQSDSAFGLSSSLYRLFERLQEIYVAGRGWKKLFNRKGHEGQLLLKFKSHAHLYFNPAPENVANLEWLSLMQHHGTATRLLDVTFSPYVAAYFALEGTGGGSESVVYAIQQKILMRATDKVRDTNSRSEDFRSSLPNDEQRPYLFFYEPLRQSERLAAQQGLFLVPSTLNKTCDEILQDYSIPKGCLNKLLISKSVKYEGLRRLRLMNISAATLFPGLDGFCKSLNLQPLEDIKNLGRVGGATNVQK
jgi:hypothetical protein